MQRRDLFKSERLNTLDMSNRNPSIKFPKDALPEYKEDLFDPFLPNKPRTWNTERYPRLEITIDDTSPYYDFIQTHRKLAVIPIHTYIFEETQVNTVTLFAKHDDRIVQNRLLLPIASTKLTSKDIKTFLHSHFVYCIKIKDCLYRLNDQDLTSIWLQFMNADRFLKAFVQSNLQTFNGKGAYPIIPPNIYEACIKNLKPEFYKQLVPFVQQANKRPTTFNAMFVGIPSTVVYPLVEPEQDRPFDFVNKFGGQDVNDDLFRRVVAVAHGLMVSAPPPPLLL